MNPTIRRMGGDLLNHTLDLLLTVASTPQTHPRDAIKIRRKVDGRIKAVLANHVLMKYVLVNKLGRDVALVILNKTFGQVFKLHIHT